MYVLFVACCVLSHAELKHQSETMDFVSLLKTCTKMFLFGDMQPVMSGNVCLMFQKEVFLEL